MMALCPGRTSAHVGVLSSPIAATPQGPEAVPERGALNHWQQSQRPGNRKERRNRHQPFSMSARA